MRSNIGDATTGESDEEFARRLQVHVNFNDNKNILMVLFAEWVRGY